MSFFLLALNINMKLKYDVVWKSKLLCLQGKEEEIIKQHLDDKISVSKLSKIYQCDRKAIKNIIIKNGKLPRSAASPKIDGHETNIIKMYTVDKLTIQTIRKIIGCSYGAIKTFLKKSNVEIRSADESRKTEDGKVKNIARKLQNKDDLKDAIEMYESGSTLEVIGQKYNITPTGLRSKFLKLGICLRTSTESANLPTTHERKKDAYIAKYGVENPMQHPEIYEKSNINRYKFKSSDIHGRRFSHLQGFEPQGIKYLIETMKIDVNDIQTGRKVPNIRYKFKGKNKTYFPDIYIKNKNLLVEVKCQFTYNDMFDLNKAKRTAAVNKGYNYITIIFSNSGDEILEILKFNQPAPTLKGHPL